MSSRFTVIAWDKLFVISTRILPIIRIKGILNVFGAGAGANVCSWA